MDVFSRLLSGVGMKSAVVVGMVLRPDAGGCEFSEEDSAWRYIWVAKRRGILGGVIQWLKGIRPSVSSTALGLC